MNRFASAQVTNSRLAFFAMPRYRETAARELGAWARSQGIRVEFKLRREGGVNVTYVFLAPC